MDIVKRLRVDEAAYDADDMDLHQDAADEIKRLRGALREIYEVYAGSEGIPQPLTAAEGYLLSLFMETVRIAQESMKEGK